LPPGWPGAQGTAADGDDELRCLQVIPFHVDLKGDCAEISSTADALFEPCRPHDQKHPRAALAARSPAGVRRFRGDRNPGGGHRAQVHDPDDKKDRRQAEARSPRMQGAIGHIDRMLDRERPILSAISRTFRSAQL
jgi:hypothetical protein